MTTINYLRALMLGLCILMFIPLVKGNGGTVVTITYQSTTQNTSCKMNVYLPSGYNTIADTVNFYPAFYLIHGGSENYNHWVNSGNAQITLDNYISSGKAVPMILVMPDAKDLAPEIFTKELINDIIPYIERNYRVKKDKDHRGVGGLSWGGLQALDAGIFHYKLFGYLSILSSGWFDSDIATYSKAKNFLALHGKNMEDSIRYLYLGEGTSSDIAYNNGLATMKFLREGGLTVHYWEHPGGHTWQTWREDLKSFLPYLFRDSTTRYVSLNFQGGNITESTIMTHLDSVVTPPANPIRYGYTFGGWYKEAACINSFNSEKDIITKNITLYAKWSKTSLSIKENDNIEISIFPNPASSTLQINNLPSSASISVYNLQGKLMLKDDLNTAYDAVNIENLTPGIYQTKIIHKDFEYNQRLIICR